MLMSQCLQLKPRTAERPLLSPRWRRREEVRVLLKGLEHEIDVSHNPRVPFPQRASGIGTKECVI